MVPKSTVWHFEWRTRPKLDKIFSSLEISKNWAIGPSTFARWSGRMATFGKLWSQSKLTRPSSCTSMFSFRMERLLPGKMVSIGYATLNCWLSSSLERGQERLAQPGGHLCNLWVLQACHHMVVAPGSKVLSSLMNGKPSRSASQSIIHEPASTRTWGWAAIAQSSGTGVEPACKDKAPMEYNLRAPAAQLSCKSPQKPSNGCSRSTVITYSRMKPWSNSTNPCRRTWPSQSHTSTITSIQVARIEIRKKRGRCPECFKFKIQNSTLDLLANKGANIKRISKRSLLSMELLRNAMAITTESLMLAN